jgi:hypothetical protein
MRDISGLLSSGTVTAHRVVFQVPDSKPYITIHRDGQIEVGTLMPADEAARKFLDKLHEMVGIRNQSIEAFRIALADAIRRPMGVIPASAEGLITAADLDAAEERRPRT